MVAANVDVKMGEEIGARNEGRERSLQVSICRHGDQQLHRVAHHLARKLKTISEHC